MSTNDGNLVAHHDALVRRIARDQLTMGAIRYAWKIAAAGLSIVAVSAPILVASELITAGTLHSKLILFAAALASALLTFFKPGALALERRLDYARVASLARNLDLEWGRSAELGPKERWAVLETFGAAFDALFEDRAQRLLEGKVLRGDAPKTDGDDGADKAAIHVVKD